MNWLNYFLALILIGGIALTPACNDDDGGGGFQSPGQDDDDDDDDDDDNDDDDEPLKGGIRIENVRNNQPSQEMQSGNVDMYESKDAFLHKEDPVSSESISSNGMVIFRDHEAGQYFFHGIAGQLEATGNLNIEGDVPAEDNQQRLYYDRANSQGDLMIILLDENDDPVNGATVKLYESANDRDSSQHVVEQTESVNEPEEGAATFDGLEKGDWFVEAQHGELEGILDVTVEPWDIYETNNYELTIE